MVANRSSHQSKRRDVRDVNKGKNCQVVDVPVTTDHRVITKEGEQTELNVRVVVLINGVLRIESKPRIDELEIQGMIETL